jgi:hypothetical protein
MLIADGVQAARGRDDKKAVHAAGVCALTIGDDEH